MVDHRYLISLNQLDSDLFSKRDRCNDQRYLLSGRNKRLCTGTVAHYILASLGLSALAHFVHVCTCAPAAEVVTIERHAF